MCELQKEGLQKDRTAGLQKISERYKAKAKFGMSALFLSYKTTVDLCVEDA